MFALNKNPEVVFNIAVRNPLFFSGQRMLSVPYVLFHYVHVAEGENPLGKKFLHSYIHDHYMILVDR